MPISKHLLEKNYLLVHHSLQGQECIHNKNLVKKEAQILIFLMEKFEKIWDGVNPLVWTFSLLFQSLFRKNKSLATHTVDNVPF